MKSRNTLKTLFLATMIVSAQYAHSEKSQAPNPITKANIDKALQQLDHRALELMKMTGLPGMAIAVVKDDKLIYAKGFGVRRLGTQNKVDANTLFQLASMSKSIGASVVAAAITKGIVQWDDPIVKHLPDFKLSNPEVGARVTIADMYAHRSGLPAYAGNDLEDLGFKRAEIIDRLQYLPLNPFLVTYNYANYDITSAGQAVATASKLAWEDLSAKLLYKPLGMRSTSSRWADYNKASNKASLHSKNSDGKWIIGAMQPDQQSPAAGVSSNVKDLAKWMIMMLNNGKPFINKEAILAMRHLPDNVRPLVPEKGDWYALGMEVRTDDTNRIRLHHDGHFSAGAATMYELLPSAKLGIVVLTNGLAMDPKGGIVIGLPQTIIQEFYDMVEKGGPPTDRYKEIVAKMTANISKSDKAQTPDFATGEVSPELTKQITGTYSNPYFGPVTILNEDGQLKFSIGPKHSTFLLRQLVEPRAFAFIAPGGSWNNALSLKFKSNPASITIDAFDGNGLGTFNKIN